MYGTIQTLDFEDSNILIRISNIILRDRPFGANFPEIVVQRHVSHVISNGQYRWFLIIFFCEGQKIESLCITSCIWVTSFSAFAQISRMYISPIHPHLDAPFMGKMDASNMSSLCVWAFIFLWHKKLCITLVLRTCQCLHSNADFRWRWRYTKKRPSKNFYVPL